MKNVLSKLTRRVRSRRGESLIETLAAILILTMASIVLYSMITTSADINMKADAMAKTNQTNLVAVEQAAGTPTDGTCTESTVTFTINGVKLCDQEVWVYGSTDKLYAYYPAPEGGGTR